MQSDALLQVRARFERLQLEMMSETEAPSLESIRELNERFFAEFPIPAEASIDEVDAGGVPALWVRMPGVAEDRTILHVHGGGWVIGSASGYRSLGARLSAAAGCRVLVLDYRLAPEHPYPAARDDVITAYRWLLEQGNDPGGIVLSGDSAGGGTVPDALTALRDQGAPLPAAGVCMSPCADLTLSGETVEPNSSEDPCISIPFLQAMVSMYVSAGDPVAASPLFRDLRGLPPLLITVGTAEVLLSDATRLAERAREAGVDVTLRVADDMIHVWQLFAETLPEARMSIEEIGSFVVRHGQPAH